VPLSLASRLKLQLNRGRIRRQHYESCFGDAPAKYGELQKWLKTAAQIEGDFLEFGVAKGGTTCLIAEWLGEAAPQKTLHSFDSFAGFDEAEFDRCMERGDVTTASVRSEFRADGFSREYVEAKLEAFGFDRCVKLYEGFFEQTVPRFLTAHPALKFAFALIDCDLADSVDLCINAALPRMVPGGVLLFDDYVSIKAGKPMTAYSPGVRRVVDAFVRRVPTRGHGLENGLYYVVTQ
jgi:hypothetical protein